MSKLLPLASLSVVLAVGVMLVGCSNQPPALGADTGQDAADAGDVYTGWPFDADEAKRRQRETAKALDQPEEITNSIGMTLKLIPAGEFLMGSPEDEDDRSSREGPQHRGRITQPFYLGETEVTQGQWQAVMGSQPWSGGFVEEGSDYAASYITWKDAVAFCERLSEKEGRKYRLPTEAEWEYACRAGTSTAYCFGDDPSELGEHAWFRDNARDVDEGYAHEVGRKRANDFGLYDMHGNVWEWCADGYDSDFFGDSYRVYRRSGGWCDPARSCQSSSRKGSPPTARYRCGFRVARGPVE